MASGEPWAHRCQVEVKGPQRIEPLCVSSQMCSTHLGASWASLLWVEAVVLGGGAVSQWELVPQPCCVCPSAFQLQHAACLLLDLTQFQNHPETSAMIEEQDKTMLRYLVDLQVRMGRRAARGHDVVLATGKGRCDGKRCAPSNALFPDRWRNSGVTVTSAGSGCSLRATPTSTIR